MMDGVKSIIAGLGACATVALALLGAHATAQADDDGNHCPVGCLIHPIVDTETTLTTSTREPWIIGKIEPLPGPVTTTTDTPTFRRGGGGKGSGDMGGGGTGG